MTAGLWLLLIAIIIIALAFIKAFLRICAPNEILIFSGRARRLPDGSKVGYRIIKGGRGFKVPILETVQSMSLETMPIDIELNGALAQGIIPLNVASMANIKIAGSEEQGLGNAVERFLGKSSEDIARIARETLEGSVRGVLATLTPEEANSSRVEFAQEVMIQASEDFTKLGLVLDTFKIQNISDSQRYLEAIGRQKNAEVQRDAKIVEAESEADARKVSAAAKKEGNVAEAESEMITVEARNQLRVKTAELEAESNQAEARAEIAGQIARVEEEKTLQGARVDLNKSKHEVDVVVPQRPPKQPPNFTQKATQPEFSKTAGPPPMPFEWMREQWEQGETRDLFLIQLLPEIVEKVSSVVTENLSIEKLTVVDSGNGNGIPTLVKGLTGSVVSIIEEIKNATGLDIPDILSRSGQNAGQIQQPRD